MRIAYDDTVSLQIWITKFDGGMSDVVIVERNGGYMCRARTEGLPGGVPGSWLASLF